MDATLLIHFAAALFAILDPVGNLPVFISATSYERVGAQRYIALFLALFVGGTLMLFFWSGSAILRFFGVSLPSFQIAGGILLLLSGIAMVQGQGERQTERLVDKLSSESDLEAAGHRFRNLLIPVGIPLFVGPGSISTVILFGEQAGTVADKTGMALVILAITVVVYVVLLLGQPLGRLLGSMGLDITTRLMGLILAAIGVQFVLTGLMDWLPRFQTG
jgi:MarC family membrane protein